MIPYSFLLEDIGYGILLGSVLGLIIIIVSERVK